MLRHACCPAQKAEDSGGVAQEVVAPFGVRLRRRPAFVAGRDSPRSIGNEWTRQRSIQLLGRPRGFPIAGGRTNPRDVLGRREGAGIPEAVAHIRGDVRNPLVLVRAHRHHDLRIDFAVHWAGKAVHHGLDHVVAMAVDTRRPGQRRSQRGTSGSAGCRCAAAVGAVARVAQLGVDGTAALEAVLLLRSQGRTPTSAAPPDRGGGIQNPVGDKLHASRPGAVHHRLHRR